MPSFKTSRLDYDGQVISAVLHRPINKPYVLREKIIKHLSSKTHWSKMSKKLITRYHILFCPKNIFQFFSHRVSQIIDSSLDPDKNCHNYPFNNFTSYRECDEDYVYKEYVHKYQTMPFWVAANIQEVTSIRSDMAMDFIFIIFLHTC